MEIKDTKYIVLIPELVDFDQLHKTGRDCYGTGYYGLHSFRKAPVLISFQNKWGDSILEHFTLYKTEDSALEAIEKARAYAEKNKYIGMINGMPIETTYIERINRLKVLEVEITREIKGL